jgi:hypothetical protein
MDFFEAHTLRREDMDAVPCCHLIRGQKYGARCCGIDAQLQLTLLQDLCFGFILSTKLYSLDLRQRFL